MMMLKDAESYRWLEECPIDFFPAKFFFGCLLGSFLLGLYRRSLPEEFRLDKFAMPMPIEIVKCVLLTACFYKLADRFIFEPILSEEDTKLQRWYHNASINHNVQ